MVGTLKTQTALGFLGVNLRQERMTLADQDMAKAINADLHIQPGAILLRLGRTKQFNTALSDLHVRKLFRLGSRRYQVAGRSWYRDQSRILNGLLSANLVSSMIALRPLNDTSTWTFLADDMVMRKDDGTSTYQWGIEAPNSALTATASSAAGSLTGAYLFRYTYARIVDGAIAHESNPSPASSSVSLSAKDADLAGIAPSADPQVNYIRIYRTLAGGSTFFFDQQIANGVTTASSSHTDVTISAESELDFDNDVPPLCSWAVEHQGHAFLCRDADNPHYLWWSKRFHPEAVPTDNFLEVGNPEDPIQCAVSNAGLLGVFTRLRKYRILGNSTSGFTPVESISKRGTTAPHAAVPTPKGTLFVSKDGLFSTDFTAEDIQLADAILPLFFNETVNDFAPINWDAASTMSMAFFKDKIYWAYPSGDNVLPDMLAVYSNTTKRWYFYQYPRAVTNLLFEEEADQLVAGSTNGYVYVLEDGSSDAGNDISLTVETKDYFGDEPHTYKLFQHFKVDADLGGESLTLDFYVDGTLKHTTTITGSRTKVLLNLPEGCLGYQWRVRLRYTGQSRIRMYGVTALWEPLAVA